MLDLSISYRSVDQFKIGPTCFWYAGDQSQCFYYCRIKLFDGRERGGPINEIAIARLLRYIPHWRVEGETSRFQVTYFDDFGVPDVDTLIAYYIAKKQLLPWLS